LGFLLNRARRHIHGHHKPSGQARVRISNDLTINELIAADLRHAKTYYLKNDRKNTNTVSIP
jgi:hypothetical protein